MTKSTISIAEEYWLFLKMVRKKKSCIIPAEEKIRRVPKTSVGEETFYTAKRIQERRRILGK